MEITTTGKISESGNGLNVNVGDYCYSSENNAVYTVTGLGAGTIQTEQGSSNWIDVEVEYYGEPSDISNDDFDAAWGIEILTEEN